MGRVAAVMAERERRQKAERDAEELRHRVATFEREKAEAKAQRIDPITDPDGYDAAMEQRIAQVEARAVQRASAMWSLSHHGKETTEAAEAAINAAIKTSPALAEELFRHPNPYDFAVQWHKKQQLLTTIGDDPDAFVRRRAVELGLIAPAGAMPAAAAHVPSTSTQPPPRSLASAPAAGAGGRGVEPNPTIKRLFG